MGRVVLRFVSSKFNIHPVLNLTLPLSPAFTPPLDFGPSPHPLWVSYMDDPSPGRTADHVTLNLLASLQMLLLEIGVYLSQGEGDINHAMLVI